MRMSSVIVIIACFCMGVAAFIMPLVDASMESTITLVVSSTTLMLIGLTRYAFELGYLSFRDKTVMTTTRRSIVHTQEPVSATPRLDFNRQPINTRQQDLFLLAKNHYHVEGLSQAEAARILVGIHNLNVPLETPWQSAATCTVHDLVGSVLKLEGERLNRFLLDMGPSVLDGMLGTGSKFDKPGGYHRVLIDQVLVEVARLKVIEDERWLLDFERPKADPVIHQLLKDHVANQGGA